MATLPRGRHGLSRAEVAADQRERMFHALAAAMTERGYVDTPVAEIIKRAGVSRETFYQHFGSKQECFIAAYAWATDALRTSFAAGLERTGTPLECFADLLGRYLAALAEDPGRARLFLVEVYAAGPQAMRRRVEVQQEAVAALAQVFSARTAEQRFACEALLAAIIQLVTTRITLDEPEALAGLHAPLVALAASLFPS